MVNCLISSALFSLCSLLTLRSAACIYLCSVTVRRAVGCLCFAVKCGEAGICLCLGCWNSAAGISLWFGRWQLSLGSSTECSSTSCLKCASIKEKNSKYIINSKYKSLLRAFYPWKTTNHLRFDHIGGQGQRNLNKRKFRALRIKPIGGLAGGSNAE
jgi:hypothetical protein